MLVPVVRRPGQMFSWMVRRAPGMFAWAVAIFRDKYHEIDPLKGECNREIDLFCVMVCREFPISVA